MIGAGLGGLFCGALLSKEGYRVTVLEKNAGIGGGLQNFVRKGEMYETGMHVAGGFHENGSLKRICCYLGIMDRLDIRFSDLMSSLTYLDTDRTFNIPSGRDRFTAYLISLFPHEEENIKRYVDALFRLSEEDRLFYMKSGQNSFFDHRGVYNAGRQVHSFIHRQSGAEIAFGIRQSPLCRRSRPFSGISACNDFGYVH